MQQVWQRGAPFVSTRLAGGGLAGASLLLAGCSGPLSILDPGGPSAGEAALLWWGMFIGATLVLLAVVWLWLEASARTGLAIESRQERRIGQRWLIGGGLILPFAAIGALLVFGIPAGQRMMPGPGAPGEVLRIEVTGHQWWWDVFYPDSGIRLQDELHIPAGAPVDIHLTSADVVHSFWVPRLAGKLDALPGRSHVLRLQADEAGVYRGQCAEFCGLHHAHMQFTVTAHSSADFAAWRASAGGGDRRDTAPAPTGAEGGADR